jgi:hypothetical protein
VNRDIRAANDTAIHVVVALGIPDYRPIYAKEIVVSFVVIFFSFLAFAFEC